MWWEIFVQLRRDTTKFMQCVKSFLSPKSSSKEMDVSWVVLIVKARDCLSHINLNKNNSSPASFNVIWINKAGPNLWRTCIAQHIMFQAESNIIILQVQHIPDDLNVIANRLSQKGQLIQMEWIICLHVLQRLCKVIWPPLIELFAMVTNKKLPLYKCLWVPFQTQDCHNQCPKSGLNRTS